MTARQKIGTWCVACLFAGFALGAWFVLTLEPHVCDRVIALPYENGERPVCVRWVRVAL